MVQKILFRVMLILSLFMFPQMGSAQERGAIRPMIYGEYDKLQLLPSEIWLMKGGLFGTLNKSSFKFPISRPL